VASYTFVPPTAQIVSPIDKSGNPGNRLMKFFPVRWAGVNVYVLADNTVVQSYPTTENSDVNIPYPIGSYGDVVASWNNPIDGTVGETVVPNPVRITFYGNHSYTVDQKMANILIAAGYSDCLTQL
jgi:hypothetical protein